MAMVIEDEKIEESGVRGFAKLTKIQKSKKKLDRAQPTHPPPIQFFLGNPSVTRPEHSNRIIFIQTEYITLRSNQTSTQSLHWK